MFKMKCHNLKRYYWNNLNILYLDAIKPVNKIRRRTTIPSSDRVLRSHTTRQLNNKKFRAQAITEVRVVLRRIPIEKIAKFTQSTEQDFQCNLRTRDERKKSEPSQSLERVKSKTMSEYVPRNSEKIWRQLIANEIEVNINDIVCARMMGFKPWPARVVNVYKKSKGLQAAWVEFFGTFQVGEVLRSNCVPFLLCNSLLMSYCSGEQKRFTLLNNLDDDREDFMKNLTKKQQFIQAIRDAEVFVKLPVELSILNDIKFA